MTFNDFVERYLLTLKIKEVPCPPEEAWVPGVRKFNLKIKSPGFDKSLKTPYKCGPDAGDPEVRDVLTGLRSDCLSVECTSNKWDFISEYGYTDEPQKGEEVYLACVEQLDRARQYFGAVVFDELMNCEE